MHTARSRNDQVVTDFKLWVKDSTYLIIDELNSLMKNIVNKAEKILAQSCQVLPI